MYCNYGDMLNNGINGHASNLQYKLKEVRVVYTLDSFGVGHLRPGSSIYSADKLQSSCNSKYFHIQRKQQLQTFFDLMTK